jgi:hypothetical protein
MARPVRPEFLSRYKWIDLAHVSRKSSENVPPSNLIQIFRSERSEVQTFSVLYNNLTFLVELMESSQSVKILT